jgi:hypothetical protein
MSTMLAVANIGCIGDGCSSDAVCFKEWSHCYLVFVTIMTCWVAGIYAARVSLSNFLECPVIKRLAHSKTRLINKAIKNWPENWNKSLLLSINKNTQKTSKFKSVVYCDTSTTWYSGT